MMGYYARHPERDTLDELPKTIYRLGESAVVFHMWMKETESVMERIAQYGM